MIMPGANHHEKAMTVNYSFDRNTSTFMDYC